VSARDDAIEAGAKAMFESGMPKAVTPWERRSDDYKRAFLAEAALIYDAMVGPMRRAVEAEIAAEIANGGEGEPPALVKWFITVERRKVAEEIAQRIHDRFDHLVAPEHESMRVVAEWCEREAREIGGAS
jgi:hypothetical protein